MKTVVKKFFELVDIRSALSFLTVGSITALINFSLFTFLFRVMQWDYKVAVSISYFFSVNFHFAANRFFTFRSHGADLWLHLSKYMVMISINYAVTLFMMTLVVEDWHLSPYMGVLCAIAVTVGVGYLMSKFWVFQRAD